MPANRLPLRIWQYCEGARGFYENNGIRKPIERSEFMAISEGLGATQQDFDRAIMIENIVYPMHYKSDKEKRKK